MCELFCLSSRRPTRTTLVTGGHWSPLAEGEIVVVSEGKLVEMAGRKPTGCT